MLKEQYYNQLFYCRSITRHSVMSYLNGMHREHGDITITYDTAIDLFMSYGYYMGIGCSENTTFDEYKKTIGQIFGVDVLQFIISENDRLKARTNPTDYQRYRVLDNLNHRLVKNPTSSQAEPIIRALRVIGWYIHNFHVKMKSLIMEMSAWNTEFYDNVKKINRQSTFKSFKMIDRYHMNPTWAAKNLIDFELHQLILYMRSSFFSLYARASWNVPIPFEFNRVVPYGPWVASYFREQGFMMVFHSNAMTPSGGLFVYYNKREMK